MFLATVLMALKEIRRNSLRSALTMLGVVIGVGAVIALVSVGRGATAKVTEDVGKLGRNLLMVMPGRSSGSFRFFRFAAWCMTFSRVRSLPHCFRICTITCAAM